MKTKDQEKIEKVKKYNLDRIQPKGDRRAARDTYDDQMNGIIRMVKEDHQSEEEFHSVQEQHNANHALYYFSMITDAMIRGRSTGNDCQKIKRIREHMMNLREFINEENVELKQTIDELLARINRFCPVNRKQFTLFIYENWQLIRTFAKAYGHEERCFANHRYEMLRDVALGRCIFRLWWWQIRIQKITMKLSMAINKLGNKSC